VTTPNRTPVIALITANGISLLGSTLTTVAIPWFVLVTTGSAGKAGLSGAFAFLPSFVAGIFGGAVVDRLGARISAVCSDLVSGLSILMIPILYHTIGLQFWQLLILVLAGSLLDIPGVTARRAMLPELASLGNVRLERVNSLLEGNFQIAFLLGPPVAGVLIGVLGASNVLWIDAASSLISLTAILVFIPRTIHGRARTRSNGYVADLREGLRFLWHDSVLRWISITLAVSNAFGAPFFSLMFAVYAKDRFDDARYLGLMLSAFGLGAVVGTALYGWIGFRFSRRMIMMVVLAGFPVAYLPIALSLPFALMLGIFLVSGLFDGPINPMLVTVRLERIPVELRGRVFASTSAVSQLFPPMTIPLAGLMIEQFGLRTTAITFTIGSLVSGLLLAALPVWRRLDETAPSAPASP
jgi:MFS family permease